MKKQVVLEEQLYRIGIASLFLGGLFIYLYLQVILPNVVAPPCFWMSKVGIYCPGCGGTRAISALLSGNLLESLWCHPMVIYVAVIYGGFMLSHTLEKLHVPHIKGWKFHEWYLWCALGILIGNWILKNVLLFCFHVTL